MSVTVGFLPEISTQVAQPGMSYTGTSLSVYTLFSSIGAFPNVGGTINQSPQISVPHQSNAICDRSLYDGNGSISINYSQIGSAIAPDNNSNFMLAKIFFL